MRSHLLFYSFDTKSKPGKLICLGIRFETLELDAESEAAQNATLKLLCPPNMPKEIKTENFVHAVKSNF